NVSSETPIWRTASAIAMPWPRKTSTCRSFVTISSGLCRLSAIVVLLHGQNHTSRWTRSMGVDQLDVMDLLRGFEAFGEASRTLARAPQREQEQEHRKRDSAVAEGRPRPRASGDPGEQSGDHRRPRFQSSMRA